MRISAHFLPEDLPVFLESVRTAERAGYSRAWLVDSHALWQDCYVYMTHGLAATERLFFGTAVANPTTRHYTVTASVHATLAKLHPGRVILGMGRGDSAVRTLGRKPALLKELREIVPRLRELLAGGSLDVEGAEVRLRWAGEEEIPIMMAATGPKSLRLAGALADIVMLQVGTHPAAVAWGIDHVRSGAEEAGRDPDGVEIAIVCGMWVSEDLSEGRAFTRFVAAAGANHVEDVLRSSPDHGMPRELSRIVEIRNRHYDYYGGHLDSLAEHADYLTDDLIDDFAILGSPEACTSKIRELGKLGVAEVSAAYLNGQLDQMERVGREIIPVLGGIPAGPEAGLQER